MKAYETTFQKMIEGTKEFQVPLYQRPYSWGRDDLDRLWTDLAEQMESDAGVQNTLDAAHFMGSLVLAPHASSAGDLTRWLVIDGQQRLTSLTIALTAVRDRLRALHEDGCEDAAMNADRINDTYLVNRYKSGADHYRLLPTQTDRAAFKAMIGGTVPNGDGGGVRDAYGFFLKKVARSDMKELLAVERVVRGRLSLVEIQAEPSDNVFRIFESLNNTGQGLRQSDLLRNYVFMLLPDIGDAVYEEVWAPMQEELGPDTLETLAWLDLVLRGDHRVKHTEVYRGQQERLQKIADAGGQQAVRVELEGLRRSGQLLQRVVSPDHEDDDQLRAALERLAAWGNTIYRPLALRLMVLRDQGHASTAQVVRSLEYIESFLVRRMLTGIPSQGLNRIFMTSPGFVPSGAPVDESVHRYLSQPKHRWPTDRAVTEAVATHNFYLSGRPLQRTFVLRRLEESHSGGEPVDFTKAKLSIEHVMPQTLTPQWREVLAAEADGDESAAGLHARLLHTLGNLTLTAQNARLSNHIFERKQQILDRSALRMNRTIADADSWGRSEIEARAAELSGRAVRLWPAPAESGGVQDAAPERLEVEFGQALAAIPPGRWTALRDVASLVGAKTATLEAFLTAADGPPERHRVTHTDGVPLDSASRSLLEGEGIAFSASGAASLERRLPSLELAELMGLEPDEHVQREQGFLARLSTSPQIRWRVWNGSCGRGSGSAGCRTTGRHHRPERSAAA